jgi:hypothetical protein
MSKASPLGELLDLAIWIAKVTSFATSDATLKNGIPSRSENHNQNWNNFTISFATKILTKEAQ